MYLQGKKTQHNTAPQYKTCQTNHCDPQSSPLQAAPQSSTDAPGASGASGSAQPLFPYVPAAAGHWNHPAQGSSALVLCGVLMYRKINAVFP